MDVTIFEKKRLPGRPVMQRPRQALYRSYYSMGLGENQVNQPFVGGVSCLGEAAPCKISTARTHRAVGKGVADGTLCEFCTATVTGGIAKRRRDMKSSQVFSAVIADSIDVTMRGFCCDATAGMSGCDKSLTGAMMAGVRLNVPSIFMYGTSILPGKVTGRDGTAADVFQEDEQNSVGEMSDGGVISIGTGNGRRDLDVPAGRRAEWRPRQTGDRIGAVCKQAQQVGSARLPAVTQAGAKSEVIVYADQ